jgi:hypothetical protein
VHLWDYKEALEDIEWWIYLSQHPGLREIFITCACLHNFLARDTVRYNVRVGRGYPIGNNGILLSGQSAIVDNDTDHFLATQFGRRWSILVNHLSVFCRVRGFPE